MKAIFFADISGKSSLRKIKGEGIWRLGAQQRLPLHVLRAPPQSESRGHEHLRDENIFMQSCSSVPLMSVTSAALLRKAMVYSRIKCHLSQ